MFFLASLLVAVAVAALIGAIGYPFVSADPLSERMKSLGPERQPRKLRERALSKGNSPLLQQPKSYMKKIVEKLELSEWLGMEGARLRLARAGFRGPQAEVAFLYFRFISPIAMGAAAIFYVVVFDDADSSLLVDAGIVIAAIYFGIKAPELFLTNTITKRQESMRLALPDALDLILICVEAGMSIDHALRTAAREMAGQSPELADELSQTVAELSYLPERRTAYMNLVERADIDGVKHIATVLIQAEKYGTSLGQALRVTADEGRMIRMMEAEKKGAALPPKLTVPMIVFFLPVLMAVVIGPAIMQAMQSGF